MTGTSYGNGNLHIGHALNKIAERHGGAFAANDGPCAAISPAAVLPRSAIEWEDPRKK